MAKVISLRAHRTRRAAQRATQHAARYVAPAFLALAGLVLGSVLPTDTVEPIEGRVVAITDGDGFTLLTAAKVRIKVRLAEIDAPETRQPYGARAKQTLAELVFNKPVQVEVVNTDRYGRPVVRVSAAGRDVNAELVRRGAAWV